MVHQGVQPQAIAVSPKATDLPHRHRRNVGVVAKGFAPMDIAEMNLYGRQAYGCDRVSDRHAGVGVGPRVDQNAVLLAKGSLKAIHQSPFAVGLKAI